MTPRICRRIFVALSFVLATALSTVVFAQVSRPEGNELTESIQGNTPRSLQNATFLSRSNPNDVLTIVVGLALKNQKDLEDLVARQQDPQSPDYHRFITPAEFAERFGPRQSDVDRLTQYLQSNGLTILQVSPSRLFVQATGSVWQMERTFNVNINTYEVAGRTIYSNDRDPSLPLNISGIVRSVIGLTSAGHLHSAQVQTTAAPPGYSPAQIATAYNFPNVNNRFPSGTIYSGAGVTLAIASFFSYDDADVQTFWQSYGIVRQGSLTKIPVNGGSDVPHLETTLDVEQAGAQTPGANILMYSGPNSAFENYVLVFNQIVTDNLASVVSLSWVHCEPEWTPASVDALRTIFQQGAAQGMAFFVGSGDRGAFACAGGIDLSISYPSSDPNVTAVGGTALLLDADDRRASESVWIGSGGGYSAIFPRPAWQVGLGIPDDAVQRGVADVAFNADADTAFYAVFYAGQWTNAGGTSFGGPNWAALWALALEARGGVRTGNANPILYGIANSPDYPNTFFDVTTGDNGFYTAHADWDEPTGWGAPNGANLVEMIGTRF